MNAQICAGKDPRDIAAYTLADGAHHLGLPQSTVRMWSLGQRYPTERLGARFARPLIEIAQTRPPLLSFWNLVELYVLRTIRRDFQVRMRKVRDALDYVGQSMKRQRPLIEQEFLTDGVDLFVDHCLGLIKVSAAGQLAFRELLIGSLKRIERDPKGLPRSFSPWLNEPAEEQVVELDPTRAFGRLVVVGTAIPTEVLAERFRGGDSIDHLARDYRLLPALVEAALRWEQRAAAG